MRKRLNAANPHHEWNPSAQPRGSVPSHTLFWISEAARYTEWNISSVSLKLSNTLSCPTTPPVRLEQDVECWLSLRPSEETCKDSLYLPFDKKNRYRICAWECQSHSHTKPVISFYYPHYFFHLFSQLQDPQLNGSTYSPTWAKAGGGGRNVWTRSWL